MEIKGRILVVDDKIDILQRLKKVLGLSGYEVHAALSGEEALEIARKNHVDVMVTDIKMDGMDGFTLIEKVRQHNSDIQCVAMTGFSDEEKAIKALKFEVSDYVRKPFGMKEMKAAVRKAMDKTRIPLALSIMNLSECYWEMTQPRGKNSKIDLAEESNLWKVQQDNDTARARTMDKYMLPSTFPAKRPDYQKVLKTGYFVLSSSEVENDVRDKLEKSIGKLEKVLYET